MKWSDFREKYLKELSHKYTHIKTVITVGITNIHNWCTDNLVYHHTKYELLTILLSGFFIWVALFPFIDHNPIWFIPSYGVIPWFIVKFKKELVAK